MKSIATALRMLESFMADDAEQTVGSLAVRYGLPKSQVSRILSTFRQAGWLEQDERTRAYRVGLTAYAFGTRFVNAHPLTREALPVLRGVVDRCGFTATLSALDGLAPLYLLGIEAPIFVDFASRAGSYFPYYATAPGKLLTAFSGQRTRDQMLSSEPPEPLTRRTIHDPTKLLEHFALVRKLGYAWSDGERFAGIGGLAVPVLGDEGELIAALGIAYPTKMLGPDEYEYQVAILREAATVLAGRLGYRPAPMRRGALVTDTAEPMSAKE